MNQNEDGFLRELLAMFKIEAEEHIKEISSGLLELEKASDLDERTDTVEKIYREAHSLKGAARAVNLIDVETLCQSLESIFALLKHQRLNVSSDLFDTMHRAVDILTEIISYSEKKDISDIMHQLNRWEKGNAGTGVSNKESSLKVKPDSHIQSDSSPEPVLEEYELHSVPSSEDEKIKTPENQSMEKIKDFLSETVRISTTKLDSLLLQTEEMLSSKLSANQLVFDFQNAMTLFNAWKKEWEEHNGEIQTFRKLVSSTYDDNENEPIKMQFDRLLEFFERNQDQIKLFESKFNPMIKSTENNSRMLGGMVDNLLEDMKEVLMLPFSTLLKMIPKVVRDLSRDQEKEVELVTRGSTTEVDRRILEEMKDPLIHLLRNCIDHGIEKPEERIKKNKRSTGTITVTVSQQGGNKIEILVQDDGLGIDYEKVKSAAVKRGIISEAKVNQLTEQEILGLIFQSEISTSPIITDISGRGLGLAIVREKVDKLGGTVSVETHPNQGTTFRIILPVTLATFRGILIEVSDQPFLIPTSSVKRVTRVNSDMIKTVENMETISLDGRAVSLVRMADVLELPRKKIEDTHSSCVQVIVLGTNEKFIAFVVDEVSNEQEVLVKSLGKQLRRVRNIAGTTILGTGKLVAILNVSDLLKSAVKVTPSPIRKIQIQEEKDLKKSILVVEDSITSRTLLKNILTTAGYEVKATVDGLDAFTALRTEDFDLVVSDIEMPRMNGFDLVSRIRNNKKTAELPVILVTGLESREDRERGIDVGANAYIVKRSFDQSNLLEVIKKLI